MKKNVLYYSFLIAIPFVTLLLLSNSNGAPFVGVTGSPGDNGNSCIICHVSPSNFNASINIMTNIPSGGYVLGAKYQITIAQISTGAADHGFEITAENSVAAKVGIFSITDAINTKVSPNGYFVTQTFMGHEDVSSWTFDWTAPSTNVGVITFYVAGVAGNGGTVTNTQVVFNTKVIGGVLAVNDARLLQFTMYPNPSDNYVTLQLPSGTNKANVKIFDYLGKTLIQKNLNNTNNNLDVSNLSAGIYFVRIQSDIKVGTKKLVVR